MATPRRAKNACWVSSLQEIAPERLSPGHTVRALAAHTALVGALRYDVHHASHPIELNDASRLIHSVRSTIRVVSGRREFDIPEGHFAVTHGPVQIHPDGLAVFASMEVKRKPIHLHEPDVTRIADVADATDRPPIRVNLKSLAVGTALQHDLGYEHVTIKPRTIGAAHVHKQSNALVLVTEGSGFFIHKNGRVAIQRGSVVHIPAKAFHNFAAGKEGLVFESVQWPPIGQDYVLAKRKRR